MIVSMMLFFGFAPPLGILPGCLPKTTAAFCRSELAREKPEIASGGQISRVIVNDLREQARSYRGNTFTKNQVGYQAAVRLILILGAPSGGARAS
ncbi:hypothetical protein SAMN05216202_1061 [Pseudomonas mucidolens]|uniref:Uncharacterized protein n=1 Tax=Pseudomonas mucidolens TaxID=46679 RepID=A0A1H2M5A0_9PSED|nr:hypothetical protein SAMN05216202_1061 [Pseudomonas mucidolens]SQH34496.1 Uncharacterised protein [Pseudomonas mucidolens]